jgi:molybdopterin molybdotransferase
MLVRPFLRYMMGIAVDPPMFILPMGVDFSRRKSARKSMIPVMIRDGAVYPVDYHGYAHINAYAMASGILVMQIGTTVIHKGEPVHVRPI